MKNIAPDRKHVKENIKSNNSKEYKNKNLLLASQKLAFNQRQDSIDYQENRLIMASILIVEDEQGMRDFLKVLMFKQGYTSYTAANISDGFDIFCTTKIDVVISDIRMPSGSGLELLENIKEKKPDTPVILITAFTTPNDAVVAMKNGAFDYISKPFNVKEICSVISAALHKLPSSPAVIEEEKSFSGIIGQSREMLKIFDLIKRVSPSPANILIYGESGTGKELVARAIHDNSTFSNNNFVPITCSAIPEELMESELFGHVKGAFTGAIGTKPGLFQEANNGTAFLDEIGELSPIIQTKLLRVLQERQIKPVGDTQIQSINIRVIAATNKVLSDEIQKGTFREDLFYRLSVVPLRVPPLRERKSDIPLLIEHFLQKYSRLLGKEVQEISSYALEVLMNYDFPGNVRELENIIERSVALETSTIILPETFNFAEQKSSPTTMINSQNGNIFNILSCEEELYDLGLEAILTRLEKQLITHALHKTKNSKMKAAELLQMSFRSFRYKVKKYNIDIKHS